MVSVSGPDFENMQRDLQSIIPKNTIQPIEITKEFKPDNIENFTSMSQIRIKHCPVVCITTYRKPDTSSNHHCSPIFILPSTVEGGGRWSGYHIRTDVALSQCLVIAGKKDLASVQNQRRWLSCSLRKLKTDLFPHSGQVAPGCSVYGSRIVDFLWSRTSTAYLNVSRPQNAEPVEPAFSVVLCNLYIHTCVCGNNLVVTTYIY